jgi:hypothetical protein
MPTPPFHHRSRDGSAAPAVPVSALPGPDDIAVSAVALRLVAARLEELALPGGRADQ